MLNEVDKDKIRKQAKGIIENFSKSLDSVKDKVEDVNVEREEERREEKQIKEGDPEFREIMLKNAPNSDKDLIFAEKKKWE
jgi:Asp-tRNA(Asn)/Glu-tRNA(Gln) amidotransferase C subunit